MKKILLPASLFCLLTILVTIPTINAKSNKSIVKSMAIVPGAALEKSTLSAVEVASNLLYDSLKLESLGLPKNVMTLAYKGQQYMDDHGILSRDGILAICDFSQSSMKKRLYIIDTKNYRVLMNTYVAHGKNTGLNYAEKFSNISESLQSSLGFYVTKGTYFGKHGLSLKLSGIERGYNDNAEARAVVIHGAEYIGAHRLRSDYMGRSFGCPAVPQEQSDKVINLLKNGTCLFVYHPTQKYLHGSKILND